MAKPDLRIVFMGTPDFAVESLKLMVENHCNIVGVVTAPDKPAGRGNKLRQSPVKQYAQSQKIPVLQPEKLKSQAFLDELRNLKAELQVVVAFRMLPEVVWAMPSKGTFNLHASLLPDYRGAAPINWAVLNGESKTGVTTFFIQHDIDTGNIILQEEVAITPDETAGELHDKLMKTGADLVLKTIDLIGRDQVITTSQDELLAGREAKSAPKIFKDDCHIYWDIPVEKIHNLIRGLSPYPGAWSVLVKGDEEITTLKIFKSAFAKEDHELSPGNIITDGKTFLKVAANDGFINITDLQQSGRKRMHVKDYLVGNTIELNQCSLR
ncbi:MAG: methionyl-tRNA formyltransferase [Bacteroidetes bacterium]|jgi:methionyl-tRNA formyltransferase|nr:methionyl-tRNA formyltransferase [Bacteroidota bacterium]